MGTCFGRYSCSCCNCLYLKQPRSSIIRSGSKVTNSNSTLEFENFMYDYDLQEPSTSLRLQPHHHQQPSISTVVRFDGDIAKLDNWKLPVYTDKYDPKLMVNQGVDSNNYLRGESPLLGPILLNANCDPLDRISSPAALAVLHGRVQRGNEGAEEGGRVDVGGGNRRLTKKDSTSKRSMMMTMMIGMISKERQRRLAAAHVDVEPEEERVNIEGAEDDNFVSFDNNNNNDKRLSSNSNDSNFHHLPESNWDHEVNSDVINSGNELEWDDYQETLIFTDETDSLIQDIEDLTAKALKETGLN